MSATNRRAAGRVSSTPEAVEIRAAGGLVHRTRRRWGRRQLELVIVHRPRYDDWTFPKGKQDSADESDEATALREVSEETGFDCLLGAEVGATEYRDAKGRTKLVRYWLMTLSAGQTGDDFVANREVDELRWCSPAEADRLLTYEHDRVLLSHLGNLPR